MLTFLENFIAVCFQKLETSPTYLLQQKCIPQTLIYSLLQHWIWGASCICFSIWGTHVWQFFLQKTSLVFGLPLWPKASSNHRTLWLLYLEWEGKKTGSLSNIWWYSASEHQVNWNENSGLHSPEQTYPTCEKGKGNSSSQPLSTNFGEDMLLPRKNLLRCTLQNQKIQLIWFRRTSHQMFLNFPTRRVLFFSACWESPHWMATSRSSGERVVPRGFRRTMGDLFHTKRITVEVLPSWKISVKVEKDTFIQQGEHNTQR